MRALPRLSDFAREPLVHFLFLGAALFGLYSLRRAETTDSGPGVRIEISRADIEHFRQVWQRQWQRPPTDEELSGLIDAHVREEVHFREALALGLDRDDVIVRRRLAQKFEFLTEDLLSPPDASPEQLADYVRRHGERYESPARVTFSHVYFSAGRRDHAEDDARRALKELRAGAATSVAPMGDPFLMDHAFTDKSIVELGHEFGATFADAVWEADTGVWTGPVRSSFGWHLIRLSGRTVPRAPDLAEIEDRVRRDWTAEARRRMDEELFARMRSRYEVVVHPWAEEGTKTVSAAPGGEP